MEFPLFFVFRLLLCIHLKNGMVYSCVGEIIMLIRRATIKDLKIIQNEKGFCFGIDAVLLSDFAKNMKKAETVVDFCVYI